MTEQSYQTLLADDLKPDAEQAPTHNLPSSYCKERIAFELTATAQGDSFYGNALRVAKDLPEVSDQEMQRLSERQRTKCRNCGHMTPISGR